MPYNKLCIQSRRLRKEHDIGRIYDIAMKLPTNRYCLSKRWRYLMSSLVKNPGTWAAGYSNPNLVRRRGSGICPVQTRLRGREVTLTEWCTLQVSGCSAPRLKSVVLTHPWTKLDMYYSTTCACGMTNNYDLVAGRPRAWLCMWPRLTMQ